MLMKLKQFALFITLLLMLVVAIGVQAQTETPTPAPTATATLSGDMLTVQISDSVDDVNESSGELTVDATELWLGNGGAVTGQYLGLRFRGLSVPRASVIQSAYLELYSSQEQWITYSLVLAAEASDNSAAFSVESLPSQRELTTVIVDHESNVQWMAAAWQRFDEMGAVVQEVVDRPGWRSGNTISFILEGTEAGGDFGRKFITSYEGGATLAPRLVVYFVPGNDPEPTNTPTPAPTATAAPTIVPTPSECSDVPERLVVGGSGVVLRLPEAPNTPLNVRQTPTTTAPRVARLAPGATFEVVDGPVCVDGIAWFEVTFGQRDLSGWIAEGADGVYFVEPAE